MIIDASRVEGPISPMLYGQFAEFMFEDIKGGLYAELIRDRSFEEPPNAIGLPRYWERDPDDRNDDDSLSFHWDSDVFYPPSKRVIEFAGNANDDQQHSLRIDIAGESAPRRHGIHQSGIPVKAGLEYRGYLWMRALTFSGNVTVSLEADETGGERYAAAQIGGQWGDWQKYEFELTPAKTDPLSKFCILVNGTGTLWVDDVSLLPGDAIGGVRADVYKLVEALRPAFIRWPGGNVAQDYHWMWGIGPRDMRTTWVNLAWKNEPEPSDFGTDEYISFCRDLGAEPSLTVNVEGGGATPEEAAAWVQYCNGPSNSKYGSMRAMNGHPEPYRVRLWEVGNEIWGAVRGHSDAATYASNFNRYAEVMRAVDPSIQLIACGDNDLEWDRTVLRTAGKGMDYLAIHHYYGAAEMNGDPLNLMAHPLHYEMFYKQVEDLIRELAPQRSIKLAINEWNTALPPPREHSMESALFGARLMNIFERSGGWVALSAVSDMVNGWPGGVIEASRHGVFVTPTYLVNEIYNEHRGEFQLATNVQSPAYDTSQEGQAIPALDVVASKSRGGGRVFIKMVNTDPSRSFRTTITIRGARTASSAEMITINADSLEAANNFSAPNAVSVRKATISAGRTFTVDVPEHSVNVLTLGAGR